MKRRSQARPSPIPGDHGYRGTGVDSDPAVGVTSYLFAGPLAFGLIGYGLDRWFGTRVLIALGILIGLAMSIYVVWLRYGPDAVQRAEAASNATQAPRTTAAPTNHEENQ